MTVAVDFGGRLGPDLLWRDVRCEAFASSTPCLFLDRDGVMIGHVPYLSRPEQVVLAEGAVEIVVGARAAGWAVICVTNQSGVGRGRFGWSDFAAVEDRLAALLRPWGAAPDAVFACPFHQNAIAPYAVDDHPWRKPNDGMLREAAGLLNVNLAESIIIGDRGSDLEAGEAAGLRRGWLVASDDEARRDAQTFADRPPGDFTAQTLDRLSRLGDAAPWLRPEPSGPFSAAIDGI